MKPLIVVGTRPEYIKLWPVYAAMARAGHDPRMCFTGQHTTLLRNLEDCFPVEPARKVILQVDKFYENEAWKVSQHMRSIAACLEQGDYTHVVVQGDTRSALAGAQAGFFSKVPVIHVEAGLRTHDLASPWPEEANRQLISRIAWRHYCPTVADKCHLLQENIPAERCVVTGNTVIDALNRTRRWVDANPQPLPEPVKRAVDDGRKIVLATAHRQENRDGGVERIAEGLARAGWEENLCVVWPVHPHSSLRKQLKPHQLHLNVIDPLPYPQFVNLMGVADVVVTDSGGVQEECSYLGIPLVVCRETTERLPSTQPPHFRLVGADRIAVHRTTLEMLQLTDKPVPSEEFGCGDAADKIAQDATQCVSEST